MVYELDEAGINYVYGRVLRPPHSFDSRSVLLQIQDFCETFRKLICTWFQEPEELPKDFTKLADDKLFEYHMKMVPNIATLYKKLGVPHAPLTLIKPQVRLMSLSTNL